MSSSSNDRQDRIKKHTQSALPFEDLIAGPISAMITAQSYSAYATYQYMISLMDRSEGDTWSPKILEIITSKAMQLSKKDSGNTDTSFAEKKQLLKIPLLSLLPVPYISIDEAEISFNANIIHHEVQKDTTNYEKKLKEKKKIPFFTAPTSMYAVFVSNKKSTNEVKSHLNVKIKIKQQELPLGLEKYIQILGNSITTNDVK